MPRILRGDIIAREMELRLRAEIDELVQRGARAPVLAVVLVGDDPASEIYVRRKRTAAERVGIRSIQHRLDSTISQADLLALVDRLNHDPEIDGILVQLPLPAHIASDAVLGVIAPEKDVDGFHPVNVGRLSTGTATGLVPCTPLGCMILLDEVIKDFRGLNAVVIGKSNIVGKPVALMLLERECTVTVTHIHTRDLPDIVRRADIVVVAAGSPGLVRGAWVKPGAVVIDVGINRVAGNRIVGDAVADELEHAAVITPVPGGVGPMTIVCLLSNTLAAAKRA